MDFACKTSTYAGVTGQLYQQYELDKDTCMTLLLGYDAVSRMRVVKRWQELEAKEQKNQIVLPNFTDPIEAATAWIEQYKEKQVALQLLEVAKPKVDYVDKYVDRGALKKVTDVAKEMKTTAIQLGKWLRANKYAFKTTDKIIWTKGFIDKGYGEMKKFTSDSGYDGTQSLVTAAGDLFIKQNFTK